MDTKRDGTYVQCRDCGHIYYIEENIPINKLYITSFCPKCDEYGRGLNCGNSKDDLYLYCDVNADPRYYEY